jgi:hypothetical protein
MPWKSTYGAQGIELHFSERCDGHDLLAAHESIYRHKYAEGLHYVIADFSCVEYLDLSFADLLRIAEHDRQYLLRNPAHLLVMVAPQAPVLGWLRTYERYMEGSNLRTAITNTRSEALVWLHSEMLDPVA